MDQSQEYKCPKMRTIKLVSNGKGLKGLGRLQLEFEKSLRMDSQSEKNGQNRISLDDTRSAEQEQVVNSFLKDEVAWTSERRTSRSSEIASQSEHNFKLFPANFRCLSTLKIQKPRTLCSIREYREDIPEAKTHDMILDSCSEFDSPGMAASFDGLLDIVPAPPEYPPPLQGKPSYRDIRKMNKSQSAPSLLYLETKNVWKEPEKANECFTFSPVKEVESECTEAPEESGWSDKDEPKLICLREALRHRPLSDFIVK
eukprot:CAMPEP_0167797726 /NCGR_PEP_ID=MMETSP0111_2-20121227/15841_1 /TAXON_ID=91324 /ORGANISM="Lotharella globosa, Strain CCCM811" /LENGTH=256 /DNA_ID=CAMNT_0007691917 /DNA_START=20 /DNA_END=790 /DNA_ORIENTATION=-